ncbi:MAG TPA: S-methyl-5-thioribose-1-phosphate isomerase [Acidobacteriota bacterium]|nr:S-methyl-5-thioribose-1-phosphate isomerase [Acidobacteriota bacterium]
MFRTLYWDGDAVVMLDQRLLPHEEKYNRYEKFEDVAQAITDLVVRGAPAIGVAAGMGIALGVAKLPESADLASEFEKICERMAKARPTAVNLFWAIDRMRKLFEANNQRSISELKGILIEEAVRMHDEDIASCKAIGRFGGPLMPDEGIVLTHCNAGALATAGYGTALGVIRGAIELGKRIHVYSDETRPFNQGARLTTWELMKDGIGVTHICDNMAGYYMQQGKIEAVVVGSDRIAANGDVANKIGTFSVAVLAKEHGIPFYVAAPLSTVDFNCPDGSKIPIEERSGDESAYIGGIRITPEGVPSAYPAFDVTPARLVTAIITDKGVAEPPYLESLLKQRDG